MSEIQAWRMAGYLGIYYEVVRGKHLRAGCNIAASTRTKQEFGLYGTEVRQRFSELSDLINAPHLPL
jgi:hypothetical protein